MSRRHHGPGLLLPLMLLLIALLWTIIGAPLSSADWQAVPQTLRRESVQLLRRVGVTLIHWLPLTDTGISAASADASDTGLTLAVYDQEIGSLRLLPLEDYVRGVVAAEMPASYAQNALRAQAVATRTRAIWACRDLGGNGCAVHPGADVCTDSACCQGYLTPEAQKARWQSDYPAFAARIDAAVSVTAGTILTSEGMPIEVLYHAFSGGMTEDAAAVFSSAKSYLVSVVSPGEESIAGAQAEQSYTHEEAATLLLTAFPDCGISADGLPGQLKVLSSSDSGRVTAMLVGSETVTGAQFRNALSLRSTLFTWDSDGRTITFHVRGSGHGVGMSQGGAQAMAASGSDWREILAHYYPGTSLSTLPDMHD